MRHNISFISSLVSTKISDNFIIGYERNSYKHVYKFDRIMFLRNKSGVKKA